MRYTFHSVLKPGHEADYERDHREVPGDLVEAFARVGIHDWTIWRSGLDLFHLVELDDYDAVMAALAEDPADAAWQGFIGRHVDRFEAPGDDRRLPMVWDFRTQREG